MKTDDEEYGGATAEEVIDSLQEEVGRLRAECDGAGRVIASLIVERDEERFERKALQIVIDGQNDVIKLRVRERDEALAELQHARDLIGETVGMSYYTAAEIGVRDYTHSLPSAMLGVIRERDRWREYVERLEAALVEHATSWDTYQASMRTRGKLTGPFAISYSDTMEKYDKANAAETACLALGREIAGRKP